MKRLEVTAIISQSEKVEVTLVDESLLYTSSKVKVGEEECKVYWALIPDQLVDKTIEVISEKLDLRRKENTIAIFPVEGVVSTHLDRLKEKALKEKTPKNPLERLVETTQQFTHLSGNLVFMALFAALIALAGLFLDNIAIVIGAMLLSPLLGPINAFAVNASLGRIKKALRSQISILVLLGSVIALSFAVSTSASRVVNLPLTSQILSRSQASIIDIGVALILGCAGGLALFAAIPETLIGVAVAVALLPPTVVSGIGLATGEIELFLGALILTLINLLGLQLGGTLILRIKGVSPRKYYQKAEAKKESLYSILALLALLVILGILLITRRFY